MTKIGPGLNVVEDQASTVVELRNEQADDPTGRLRAPILEALDQLRIALDVAVEQERENAAGLLIMAISDVADTLDLIDMNPDA